MKTAFAGKGGSGKTTLSSLFTRHLAARGLPVLAIDAAINQESGVIRVIRAEVDPAAAGFPLQLYVTATLARHDQRAEREPSQSPLYLGLTGEALP